GEHSRVLLGLSTGTVSLISDLGTCVLKTSLPSFSDGEVTPGTVPVQSRVFFEIAKTIRGSEVNFSYSEDDGLLTITTDRANWEVPFGLFSTTDISDEFSVPFSVP